MPLAAQDSGPELFHLRKSSCSARDCLGEPVETPESDPPLEVESRSLLQGTEADRRIVTVDPSEEEREREHKTFSETLKYKHWLLIQLDENLSLTWIWGW